jgi:hypothetical protein
VTDPIILRHDDDWDRICEITRAKPIVPGIRRAADAARVVEDEMRTILARLDLCSSAPTQSFDSDGGGKSGENPGGKRPPGENGKAGDYYRGRLDGLDVGLQRRLDSAEAIGDFGEAETRAAAGRKARRWHEEKCAEILRAAKSELAQITGRDGEAPQRHIADLDNAEGIADAVADEAPGKPAKRVAEILGLNIFMVGRMYAELGLDPFDGTPIIAAPESVIERVLRYEAQGLTQKQIGTNVGLSQPSVSRILRTHRRAA